MEVVNGLPVGKSILKQIAWLFEASVLVKDAKEWKQ